MKKILCLMSVVILMLSAAIPAFAYYEWNERSDGWYTFNVKNKPTVKIRLKGYVYENTDDQKLVRAEGIFYYLFPDDYYNYGCYDDNCYVRATVENFWRKKYDDSGRKFGRVKAQAETSKMTMGKAHVYCGRR